MLLSKLSNPIYHILCCQGSDRWSVADNLVDIYVNRHSTDKRTLEARAGNSIRNARRVKSAAWISLDDAPQVLR